MSTSGKVPDTGLTLKQREAKKVIQNYLTKILYNNKYNNEINNILKNASLIIWKNILDDFFNNIEEEYKLDNDFIWEHYQRFYLKGGKATITSLKEEIQKYKNNENNFFYNNQIAKVLLHNIIKYESDSDWDFIFLLNPNQLYDNELIDDWKRKLYIYIVEANNYIINNFPKKILDELLILVNDINYQQKFLLKDLENNLNYFYSEDRKIAKSMILDILNLNPIIFKLSDNLKDKGVCSSVINPN